MRLSIVLGKARGESHQIQKSALNSLHLIHNFVTLALADPRVAPRDACLNSLNFMPWSAQNLQNHSLAHPLWELAPPQENSGSATELNYLH